MTGALYQDWELQIIRDHYPDFDEIEKRLPHRLSRSVKNKARQLGIAPRQAPEWTYPEVATLTRLYPDIRAICQALPHRSKKAVLTRIKLLGVGRRVRKWTPERREILRALYTSLGDKEAGEILGVSAQAVRAERKRMRLLRQRRPAQDKATIAIVQDIREEARKRGAILYRITTAVGCRQLKPSLSASQISWGAIGRVVEELGGELYVEWDD